MNAFELSEHIAQRLDEDELPYALGGALALTTWALPRDTKDVDIRFSLPTPSYRASSTPSSAPA